MSIAREDYIQRQISMIAEAVRRLRALLGGGASAEEVVQGIRAAEGELLGSKASVVRVLDSATAVRLISSPEAVRLWVQLLVVEAEAYRQAGALDHAHAVEARAEQLGQALEGIG